MMLLNEKSVRFIMPQGIGFDESTLFVAGCPNLATIREYLANLAELLLDKGGREGMIACL
jgi:hypothetical protein